MKYLTTLLFFFIIISIYPQPKDVNGWQKVQWGMTTSQVVEQLGLNESNHIIENYENSAVLKTDREVMDIDCSVWFYFKDSSLFWINITKFFPDEFEGMENYEKWKNELIRKYKDPTIHSDKHITDNNIVWLKTIIDSRWFFPSTTIILSFKTTDYSLSDDDQFTLELGYKKSSSSDEF